MSVGVGNVREAVSYIEKGWTITPLCWPTEAGVCGVAHPYCSANPRNIGKTPITKTHTITMFGPGQEDDARAFWAQYSEANIGVLVEESGLVVLDIDDPDKLPPEHKAIFDLYEDYVVTDRGYHIYFRRRDLPLTRNIDKRKEWGWELRIRGYVVAPPSRHRNGMQYHWSRDLPVVYPEVPGFLADIIREHATLKVEGVAIDWDNLPEVDISRIPLSQETRELIRFGAVRGQRSEAIWRVIGDLVRAGCDDATIASVLVNPEHMISEKIYEKSPEQRRRYVEYQIAKMRSEVSVTAGKAPKIIELPRRSGNSTENRQAQMQSELLEVDATDLLTEDEPEEPPSLPLLGVRGYILEGWSHLIAGYPKSGKTETIFASVLTWLREGIPVLWLTEESMRVWRLRIRRARALPKGLRLVFALGEPPKRLLERAASGDESVVIIDTVRSLSGIQDEADNAQIAHVIGTWERLLRNKTRIYIHHLRKDAGEHGLAVAGGTMLVGSVDRVIELRHDPNDSKRRRLKVISRISDAPELMTGLDENGMPVALGDPSDVELDRVASACREVLSEVNGWLKTSEVWDRLDDPKPSKKQVEKALALLRTRGEVDRDPPEDQRGKTYRWRLRSVNLTANNSTPSIRSEVRSGNSAASNGSVLRNAPYEVEEDDLIDWSDYLKRTG